MVGPSMPGRPNATAPNVIFAAQRAPDLPWNCYEPDQLGPCIMKFVQEHESFFRYWAQVWFENFQFLFGNHNIRWSKRFGFAVDYDFMRQGSVSHAMKAQTNIMRVVTESIASLIYSNLPTWEVESMEESSIKGKRFRKIAQKLLDCYMQRLCMDKVFQSAAVSYVLFGQMAFHIDWDFSAGNLLEIPNWRKLQAPTFSTYMAPNPAIPGGLLETPTPLTDQQGQPIQSDRFEAVTDEQGRQIITRILSGDAFIKGRTPLEYRRALGSTGMHDTKYAQTFDLVDYDEFLDTYKNVPGATRIFRDVRPIQANAFVYNYGVRHFMRLQHTTPPTVEDGFRRENSVFKSSLFRHKVLVINHYDRPHPDKWPSGRRVVVANGQVTHITEPSYIVDGKKDGWVPLAEAQWMTVAPSSISPGPTNDVTRKNRELNVKDSLNATSLRRNMGSQLLIKKSLGADKSQFTGEPGTTIEVNDVLGARWLHDEMPIPPVIAQLRQQDKDDIYEVSGAGDALRGQPSTGSSSGYQEKQREEREEKRLAPARKNFEGAVGTAGEKLYCCIKANVLKLDDRIMGFLKRAAAGEFTVQDVIAFQSTPVSFGTDIKVKKGSMALKSRATEIALMQEVAAGPAAGRLMNDAKVQDRYYESLGLEVFRDSSSSHRDRVERENEVWLDMLRLGPNVEGIQTPVVMSQDDDIIHENEHIDFAIRYAEELMQNEWLLIRFLTHLEQHRLQRQEKEGLLGPGTALQTGTMMGMTQQAAQPTVTQIYQDSMIRRQQQQQLPPPAGANGAPKPGGAPGQAVQGQRQAPQASRVTGGGPGAGRGKRTDPQTPSSTTQTAASRGGAPQ